MTDVDLVVLPPLSTIQSWSGLLINIPQGWQLCDGTNGTPDFTDKFLLGAPAATDPGTEGGENEHTLTVAEMPNHTHSTFSNGGGAHNHLAVATNLEDRTFVTNSRAGHGANSGNQAGLIDSVAGTFTIGTTGGSPHENRPPFFELAFIMRLA